MRVLCVLGTDMIGINQMTTLDDYRLVVLLEADLSVTPLEGVVRGLVPCNVINPVGLVVVPYRETTPISIFTHYIYKKNKNTQFYSLLFLNLILALRTLFFFFFTFIFLKT